MTRNDRIFKWLFNIPGVIDEHVKFEIGKATSKAVVLAFLFEILFTSGTVLYVNLNTINDFESFLYFVMMIHFLLLIGILVTSIDFQLKRQGITYQEVTSNNKQQALKDNIHKSVRTAILFFIFVWLFSTIFDVNGQSFLKILFTWHEVKLAISSSVVFGLIMYFIGRQRIQVIKDED